MSLEISPSKVDSIKLVKLKGTIVAGKDTEFPAVKVQALLQVRAV